MREIKFRAWDEDGFMFIPTMIEFDKLQPGDTWIWQKDKKGRPVFGQLGSAIIDLMQFTGLKDKNGKEIYEGDIVMNLNTKKVHRVENKQFEGYEGSVCIGFEFETSYIDKIEIIGNIWENPELLEVKK